MVVDEVAREILECVCEALAEAGRPSCSCYAVVGQPVVPPGCTCDTDTPGVETDGRTVVQFEQMYDADPNTLVQILRVHPCKRGTRVADFTVWVTRCYPTLTSQGELDLEAVDEAASDLHDDVDVIWNAFQCCLEGRRFLIRRVAVDSDPEGGNSIIAGQITVEIPLQPAQVAS